MYYRKSHITKLSARKKTLSRETLIECTTYKYFTVLTLQSKLETPAKKTLKLKISNLSKYGKVCLNDNSKFQKCARAVGAYFLGSYIP